MTALSNRSNRASIWSLLVTCLLSACGLRKQGCADGINGSADYAFQDQVSVYGHTQIVKQTPHFDKHHHRFANQSNSFGYIRGRRGTRQLHCLLTAIWNKGLEEVMETDGAPAIKLVPKSFVFA